MDFTKDLQGLDFCEISLKTDVFKDFGITVGGDSEYIEKSASQSRYYACKELNLFPVDSGENSLLSYAYYLHNISKLAACGLELDSLESCLTSALDTYGLSEEAQALKRDLYSENVLEKSSQEKSSLVSSEISGLPFEGSSLASMDASITNLPISKRASFVEKLIDSGIDVVGYSNLETYAGLKSCDFVKTAGYLTYRAKKTNSPEFREVFTKLAKAVLLKDDEIPLEKLASAIDTLDILAGTQTLVRKGILPDGMSSVFNSELITKVAGVSLAGKDYSEEDFKSLPLDKWAEALGDDFVKESTVNGQFDYGQAIEIVSTLPLPQAKTLSLYLEGNK